MKKSILLLVVSFAIISCHKKVQQKDIRNLNGYWEIEKVVLANGEKKDYKINETIDYFSIQNNIGFRKKVTPMYDGKYMVNNQKEDITIFVKDGTFYITYVTPYQKWEEKIVALSNQELILENDQHIAYYYKKPIPFSVK